MSPPSLPWWRINVEVAHHDVDMRWLRTCHYEWPVRARTQDAADVVGMGLSRAQTRVDHPDEDTILLVAVTDHAEVFH
jgi:hypothetical protein